MVSLELDNRSQRLALGHIIEGGVDVGQLKLVRNVLVHHQLAVEVVLHQLRHSLATLPPTEGGALPNASRHQLEGSGGDLLPGGGHADDHRHTPALVAGFERRPHGVHVANALEGVVESSVRLLHQHLLNRPRAIVLGVDKLGEAKLAGELKLRRIDVDTDHLLGATLLASIADGQADRTEAKDGTSGARLDVGSVQSSTVASGNLQVRCKQCYDSNVWFFPSLTPQPSKHTLSSGACSTTLATEISATTVYSLKVEVPMK